MLPRNKKSVLIAPADSALAMSRRDLFKLCGLVAAVLGLPACEQARIAQAVTTAAASRRRVPVVWLELQSCTGDTESFIRAASRPHPVTTSGCSENGSSPPAPSLTDAGILELLLQVLSVEYQETLMAPAGEAAEKSREDVLRDLAGQYVCIIEGAVPTGLSGAFCTIGGQSALSIATRFAENALATIAMGNCAVDGGLPGAAPNLTGASGVDKAVPNARNLINLPGCPANVVNLVACIVHLITYGTPPPLDAAKRPLFAYGKPVHHQCERQPHFMEHHFVRAWGDEGHRKGWCLYQMGCKGPSTNHNCPTVKWNQSTNWCVGAGHGCIGCAAQRFWDTRTPFYVPGPMEMEEAEMGSGEH